MPSILRESPSVVTDQALPIDDRSYRELVAAARLAPSPDNNQPWAFRRRGSVMELHHLDARNIPSDSAQVFAALAIGAALENLALRASSWGWRTHCRLRPGAFVDGEHVLDCHFTPGAQPDELADFLAERHCNRRPFAREDPGADALARLQDAAGEGARLDGYRDRDRIARMAELVSAADRLRFEHRPFHEELHGTLRWSREERASGEGLDTRTLALPPGAGAMLRFVRPWSRMALLNRLGFSRALSLVSRSQAEASGALLLISAHGSDPAQLLAAGRACQRSWLAATRDGLDVHPIAALPLFLGLHRLGRSPEGLEQRLAELDRQSAWLLPKHDRALPVMLLRIGHAKADTPRSQRMPLEELLLDESP